MRLIAASACLAKLAFIVLLLAGPAGAQQTAQQAEPDGRQILQKAVEAAGGEAWLNAKTLILEGYGLFYPQGAQSPMVKADSYRMWRVFDPNRKEAHGPDGKVRIDSFTGGKVMFQVSYDGQDTWTQAGKAKPEEAQRYWASAFGFGIIRHALKPEFKVVRAPDDLVDGHPVWMVKVTDPGGQETLFGIDKATGYIRKAGFQTPRGWHERLYADFEVLDNPRWVQARHVRLYYNGVKANEIFWTRTQVNAPIDETLFVLGEPKP
ncbi:MAG TPA: hypothetical protein VED40_04210 [Azospirillaceae bacterium]|nr:hypothetical protein [Azospirillaceae bacterium]